MSDRLDQILADLRRGDNNSAVRKANNSARVRQERELMTHQSPPGSAIAPTLLPDPNVSGKDQAANVVGLMANSWGMQLPQHVIGGFRGAEDAINAVVLPRFGGEKKDPIEEFKKGHASAINQTKQMRDDLGLLASTGAEIAGAVSPHSLARNVDRLTTKLPYFTMQRTVGPIPWDMARRAGTAGVVGGGAGAFEAYASGELDFADALKVGAFSGLFSGAMQPLLGSKLAPVQRMKDGYTGAAERDVLTNVVGNSLGGDNRLNLNTIAKWVDDGMPEDATFLRTSLSRDPLSKQWEKVNNYVAKLSFQGLKPSDYNTPAGIAARKQYSDIMDAIGKARQEVSADLTTKARNALDNPTGRKAELGGNAQERSHVSKLYSNMSRDFDEVTGEPTVGATTVTLTTVPAEDKVVGKWGDGFLDRVETRLGKAFGRTDPRDVPPNARDMYDKFNDGVRGVRVGQDRSMRNIPSRGAATEREIWGPQPLYKIMDARASLQAKLSPSMLLSGGTDPADYAAGVKLLKAVDEEIAEISELPAQMRAQWAKVKSTEQAYDVGYDILRLRKMTMDSKDAFSKSYGDTVEKFLSEANDPDITAAVKRGYANALNDEIGREGFYDAMHYLVGQYDPRVPSGGPLTKQGNVQVMRDMLGESKANELLNLYSDAKNTAVFGETLHNTLTDVVDNPDAVRKIIGQSGAPQDYVPQDVSKYEQMKTVIGSALKPSDTTKMNAILDMLAASGEDLREFFRRGLGPQPRPIGATAGAAYGTATSRTDNANQELEDYLKSVPN